MAGLSGSGIGAVQALIGVGSIGGILPDGRSAGGAQAGCGLWLGFAVAVLSAPPYSVLLALPALPLSAMKLGAKISVPWLTLVVLIFGMMVGACSLFTRVPFIQTGLAHVTLQDLRRQSPGPEAVIKIRQVLPRCSAPAKRCGGHLRPDPGRWAGTAPASQQRSAGREFAL